MESPVSSSIESKIRRIKGKMLKNFDPYSFVCPSAYDTAWLAVIPDPHEPSKPMFKICLDWMLKNQHGEGFWGECDAFGKPTIVSLPATLASMIALKKWNTGPLMVEKGLAFIHANAEKLLEEVNDHCPRWLAIILPAMVELAEKADLEVCFPETVKETVSYMFDCQENIVHKEELVGKHRFPPLLSYLEALPQSYAVNEEDIFGNLSGDGSLFQSPSATAKAFMATGKQEYLVYLQSLVQKCPNGVPERYPMDEDVIKLCMITQLHRLGLAEHFISEIEEILAQVYREYMEQKSWVKPSNMIATQLHKDSLAFQLLRMHGYKVSPLSLCWFLHDEEVLAQIENNSEYFTSAMIEVHGASNLMFCGEYELEEVRYFSRKLLEKTVSTTRGDQSPINHPNLEKG
ncbi:hypothetical protein L6164_036610 [Bauhinia variegata]|uniref:Uncharacterized protein n=1 Tax=Bauhinia variegata TaxID=167791 RepID=A0ACB9KHI8_BAUVA|nr:hypothetical protein L6164_036610 [Bauhinia variegata]